MVKSIPSLELRNVAIEVCNSLGASFKKSIGLGASKETFLIYAKDGTPQALKIYRRGASLERLKREISVLKRCDHENIARLYSVSHININNINYIWTIEEYLDRGTLKDKLANGVIDKVELIKLGQALSNAIIYLNDLECVHRDIKPENIMYKTDAFIPVLVDFSIARVLSIESITPTVDTSGPGSPLYSSPEQLNNNKLLIDWRTDQFGLGVSLAIAALGVHPYQSTSVLDERTIERVRQRKSQADSFLMLARNKGLLILQKMSAPWPYERFNSPSDLANAWNNLLHGRK